MGAFAVVEIDQPLVEEAAALAIDRDLGAWTHVTLPRLSCSPGTTSCSRPGIAVCTGPRAADGLRLLPEALA